MRKILVIGIGAGNPDHLTMQAIAAMNAADAFFVLEKGTAADALAAIREAILRRFVAQRSYRLVKAPSPERNKTTSNYKDGVAAWHRERTGIFEALIRESLAENETGAFLVWGDPSLYDSTLRILGAVRERGSVTFDVTVIPGISSVQALAAAHKLPLNRIGEPVHFTTGRRLAGGLPADADSIVVLLDDGSGLMAADGDLDIHWGAYLGTADEVLVSGALRDVKGEILRLRQEMRARKGWIMDTYLLRRRGRVD